MPSDKSNQACLGCRSRKIKCVGRDETVERPCCSRCREANVPCDVVPHKRGRKEGTKLSHEVRARLRRKYAISRQSNLAHLEVEPPSGTLARADAHHASPQALGDAARDTKEGDLGPTVRGSSSIEGLFAPRLVGPSTRSVGSDLRNDPIGYGYVDEVMARNLFAFFMTTMAKNLFIFDPVLHTYDYVFSTSSFLFSVVISVAAKYRPDVPSLVHQRCLALAKSHISKVFTDDFKDEEAIIALFTMTEYKEPTDENGYLLLGIACRLAVDLELYRPSPSLDERGNRCRSRIWLALYAADRSYNYCGQTAKPSMMPEDTLIRSSDHFKQSDLCLPTDQRLGGNVVLRRIMSSYIELFDTGRLAKGKGRDHRQTYHDLAEEVDLWRVSEEDGVSDPLLLLNIRTYSFHAKVVIAHRWLREAFKDASNLEDDRREVLRLCVQGSIGILTHMVQMPDDVIRYCGDSKHLYFAYASFLLYKTLKTGTSTQVLENSALDHLFTIVRNSAEKLDRAALSPTHTGAYHANFLRSLLDFEANSAVSRCVSPASAITVRGTLGDGDLQEQRFSVTYSDAMCGKLVQDNESLFLGGSASNALDPLALDQSYPTPDLAHLSNLSWDDWWPLDNNVLDQGTFNTLTGNGDDELQDILDSLFAPIACRLVANAVHVVPCRKFAIK